MKAMKRKKCQNFRRCGRKAKSSRAKFCLPCFKETVLWCVRERSDMLWASAGLAGVCPRYVRPRLRTLSHGLCETRKAWCEQHGNKSHAIEVYVAGPGYPELQEAFERRYVQDGNLRSYSGAVFANTLPPKPIRAPLVLKGPWFRYNDRFFQTPNTFLTQTLSIGKATNIFTWSPSVAMSSQTLCTTQQDALVWTNLEYFPYMLTIPVSLSLCFYSLHLRSILCTCDNALR